MDDELLCLCSWASSVTLQSNYIYGIRLNKCHPLLLVISPIEKKPFGILVKGRGRVTGNGINQSFIKSVERPVGTVPSISRYFTHFYTSRIKPKFSPVSKPYISILIYTINDIGHRRFCWSEVWWW